MVLFRSDWAEGWTDLCSQVSERVLRWQGILGAAVEEGWQAVQVPPTVIVIDTLGSWGDMVDSNSYSDTTNLFTPAKILRDRTDCAVILVHHNRKERGGEGGARLLGSANIRGQADQIITLSRVGPSSPNARLLEIEGRFRGTLDALTVEYRPEASGFVGVGDRDPKKVIVAVLDDLLPVGPQELGFSALRDAVPEWLGHHRLRRVVQDMLKDGELVTNGEASRSPKLAYRLPEKPCDEYLTLSGVPQIHPGCPTPWFQQDTGGADVERRGGDCRDGGRD